MLVADGLAHSCVHNDRRGAVHCAMSAVVVLHMRYWRPCGWCAAPGYDDVDSTRHTSHLTVVCACVCVCERVRLCIAVLAVLEGCDHMAALAAYGLASVLPCRVDVCVSPYVNVRMAWWHCVSSRCAGP